MYWGDGRKYIGEWKNGQRNGKGILTWDVIPAYKTPGVYNPPDAVFTVFMELPQNIPKKLGVLIGPNGRIFKAITHQSGSKYIWCNGKNIEISADKIECISDAIKRIYARCDYLETKAKRTGRPVVAN